MFVGLGGDVKIVHFVYHYWTYSGATEQAVKLSKVLCNKYNTKNIFFNFSNNNKFSYKATEDNNSLVYDIPSNVFFKILILIYLFFLTSPSVIHSHGFHRLPILVASLFRCPILLKCTLIGRDDLPSLLSTRLKFINNFILSRISMVNCLNEVIKSMNLSCFPSNKLCVIPNGVELPVQIVSVRDKFLCAGAIIPRKRPLEVIRYFNKFYTGRGYKLYLAGPYDENLGEFENGYFLECMTEINKNPTEIVLLGNVDFSELSNLYATSMALIFFSLREGTPNVVLEAISHNCPVVFCDTDVVVSSIMGNNLSAMLSVSNSFDTPVTINTLESIANQTKLYERAVLSSIDNVASMHFDLYIKLCRG